MDMVLSCISYQHSTLKQQWAQAKEGAGQSAHVLGRLEKPLEEKDGVVCIIDETGTIHQSIRMWMPTGILVQDTHLLVTGPWSIHRVARDLSSLEKDVYSMRWFNALHSITRTRAGMLVTSTGLDLLLEVDQAGNVLWSWWSMDHGLGTT